jgi:hypothetical protein
MAEHLFCKQAVAGSNPIAGSMLALDDARPAATAQNAARRIGVAGNEGFHCPMV